MPFGHAQQDLYRTVGFAPSLFPVLQSIDTHAQQKSKLLLRKLQTFTNGFDILSAHFKRP